MSAERLRRVAADMRAKAEAATPGPWRVGAEGSEGSRVNPRTGDKREDSRWIASVNGRVQPEDGRNAAHIAAWHPAVALAVADLLDLAATHEKRTGDECGQGYTATGYGEIDPSCSTCGTPDEYAEPWPCAYAFRATALADAWEATS